MTKPVAVPSLTAAATVKEATGNPFTIQAQLKGVMLLSNNTVWLKNNYVLENFLLDAKQRDALIAKYDVTPLIKLEAAVRDDGKAVNDRAAPIMLTQYATVPYDARKLGHLMILERDSLIIISTHYHTSKKVSFNYTAFEKSLIEYCHLVTLEKRRQDPIIIPLPGMDCGDVRLAQDDASYVIDPMHIVRVKKIIANTMFPEADVTLVIPS